MTEANREQARQWYTVHRRHVNDMLRDHGADIEPSGSDAAHPELWKPMHWRWFMVGELSRQMFK